MLADELRIHIRKLQGIIDFLQQRIDAAPEGKLHVCSERGHYRYYQCLPDASRHAYLGKDQIDIARALAQKDYEMQVLKTARNELNAAKRLLRSLEENRMEAAAENLHPARRGLVSPVIMTNDDFAKEWESQSYERLPVPDPGFSTLKGDRVRSKSEVIIANALFSANISYHYELPLRLFNGVLVHPDFTILNRRTREIFYWEHFGMMSDDSYRHNTLKKLRDYTKSGIIPHRQLLVTHEEPNLPLDTEVIGCYIEKLFL